MKTDIPGPGEEATVDEINAHNLYLNSLKADEGGNVRHTNDRSLPRNQINVQKQIALKALEILKEEIFK